MGDIHVLIIYNPVAGKGVIKKSLGKIKKLFSDNGIKVMTFATKGKDDAYRAAAKYAVKFGEKSENDRYMSEILHIFKDSNYRFIVPNVAVLC